MSNGNFNLNLTTADHLGIGLFKYSFFPEERFIIFNQALVEILKYSSKAEFENEKFSRLFFDPADKDRFLETVNRDKKAKFFEARFKDKQANTVWVAITASLPAVLPGETQYLEGIIEDVSSYKKLEENLATERDFFQGLLDNMPDAVYFKDKSNRIIKVNDFYAKGAGLKPEDIVGKNDFDFFPAEQAQKMFDDDNSVLSTGKPIVGKIERTLLGSGSWNQVITTKIPMYDRSGVIIGTMGITRDMTLYAQLERERSSMLINALTVLGKFLEMRDPYTFDHARNVGRISEKIGGELDWDENHLLGIRLAGELHDLGKITIPLDILNKPGKLTNLEYRFIQEHVVKCYDLIKDIEFPFSLAETVYQHHERLDGSGYPRELKAPDISIEARILAVSDVLEAMASARPYRKALGINKALEELKTGSGSKYDSGIVSVVEELVLKNGGKEFWADNN